MIRSTLAALVVAGFVAVGCDDRDDRAGTPETVKDTAKKAGNEASQELDNVQNKTKDATDAMQKDANDMNNKAAENNAEATQKAINDLIDKAKDAAENRNWAEAKKYLAQIDTVKARLPAADQPGIEKSLAEVRKLIEAGESLAKPGTNLK